MRNLKSNDSSVIKTVEYQPMRTFQKNTWKFKVFLLLLAKLVNITW